MPRRARGPTEESVYHVLNRGVRRAVLFETEADYTTFEDVMLQGLQRVPLRIVAYCAMPNHWHLMVWPTAAGQLPRFMHWFTGTHAQRWHASRGTSGTGAVYQGRYKALPIESDRHLLTVFRYVERNPLRAGLVTRAEHWRWSSLWRRFNNRQEGIVDQSPIQLPGDWVEHVNQPQTDAEVEAVRRAVRISAPFGSSDWQARVTRMSLEAEKAHRRR